MMYLAFNSSFMFPELRSHNYSSFAYEAIKIPETLYTVITS